MKTIINYLTWKVPDHLIGFYIFFQFAYLAVIWILVLFLVGEFSSLNIFWNIIIGDIYFMYRYLND